MQKLQRRLLKVSGRGFLSPVAWMECILPRKEDRARCAGGMIVFHLQTGGGEVISFAEVVVRVMDLI